MRPWRAVYHAQMADEEGSFGFDDVVEGVCRKMIRRHPHVFGDEEARSAKVAKGFWEENKAKERAGKPPAGVLGAVLAATGAAPAAELAALVQSAPVTRDHQAITAQLAVENAAQSGLARSRCAIRPTLICARSPRRWWLRPVPRSACSQRVRMRRGRISRARCPIGMRAARCPLIYGGFQAQKTAAGANAQAQYHGTLVPPFCMALVRGLYQQVLAAGI